METHKFKYPIFADRTYTFVINKKEHEVLGADLILAALEIAHKQEKMAMLDALGITYSRDISSLS